MKITEKLFLLCLISCAHANIERNLEDEPNYNQTPDFTACYGINYMECEEMISALCPGFDVQTITNDSLVTGDFRLDRVRIFYDPNTSLVTDVPDVGRRKMRRLVQHEDMNAKANSGKDALGFNLMRKKLRHRILDECDGCNSTDDMSSDEEDDNIMSSDDANDTQSTDNYGKCITEFPECVSMDKDDCKDYIEEELSSTLFDIQFVDEDSSVTADYVFSRIWVWYNSGTDLVTSTPRVG